MIFADILQTFLATLYFGGVRPPIATHTPTPDIQSVAPTILLDQGTFVGVSDGVTTRYLGIPYAKPPVGDLRFRLPVPTDPYTGVHSAANFGYSCPQQAQPLPLDQSPTTLAANVFVLSAMDGLNPQSENCLTLNVWMPAGVKEGDDLPVVAWIYAGGFQVGQTSSYNINGIVRRSIEIERPMIYVSMGYRLSALGFISGYDVNEAGLGNLGLRDQRLALRWIQKYIRTFGGDPTKVTLWGESAGSISSSLHMLANGGDSEGLFRAAVLESGYPTTILATSDMLEQQLTYATFAHQVGCGNSTNTLDCMRKVPYKTMKKAIDASTGFWSYETAHLTWSPRVDGKFLTDLPQRLISQGKIASIPILAGTTDDEATMFALSTTNVTTDAAFREYLSTYVFSNISNTQLDRIGEFYTEDPAEGAPFGTGTANAITPQFKRIAAFLGDYVFQGPRRQLLDYMSPKENTWSFVSKRQKDLPTLGATHGTDLAIAEGPGDLTDYIINFVSNLNPDGPTVSHWPKYNSSTRSIMTLHDGDAPQVVETDTFREEAIKFVTELRYWQD